MKKLQHPEFLRNPIPARLIPSVADTSGEVRATSILLAGIASVTPFSKTLLESVGQKLGKHARVNCYTEVGFKSDKEGKDRPDGLIELSTGRRKWYALVESKIGTSQLKAEQIDRYLKLAKQNNIDAVITISNQLAALPTHHPLKFTKSRLKGVSLYHWSWQYLKTQASFLTKDERVLDPDQRFILSEIFRFFDDKHSRVKGFDRMNSEWKSIVQNVRNRAILAKTSDEVVNTVAHWHQLQRNLCLLMMSKLSAPVSLRLSARHKRSPEERLKHDCSSLAKDKRLSFVMEVTDAAAPIEITADLSRRTLSCAMRLQAPTNKKTSRGRVRWLLNQLSKENPEEVHVVADWPGRTTDTQKSLAEVIDDPDILLPSNGKAVPKAFEVLMIKDLAGRFSKSQKFVQETETFLSDFYDRVGENLRAWVPPAPKLRDQDSITEIGDQTESTGGSGGKN